jgi:hypothetical protein
MNGYTVLGSSESSGGDNCVCEIEKYDGLFPCKAGQHVFFSFSCSYVRVCYLVISHPQNLKVSPKKVFII